MIFNFNKDECQKLRSSLRKEWLDTNGRGDYASSSIAGCNTRKYHGLFVVNLPYVSRRFVLLSTLEDTLLVDNRRYQLSSRQHPDIFYPKGYKSIESFKLSTHPVMDFSFDSIKVRRELLLLQSKSLLIIKYTVKSKDKDNNLSLDITPLLAYRDFHSLGHENENINKDIHVKANGFSISPYKNLPPFFMQSSAKDSEFSIKPDWCRNVEYVVEEERGFPHSEDLFMPGSFHIPVKNRESIYICCSIAPLNQVTPGKTNAMGRLWEDELRSRDKGKKIKDPLERQLIKAGNQFIVSQAGIGLSILAGYHWFDAWGRDTLIALPGLCFCSGRNKEGIEMLDKMGNVARNGLVPNCISTDGNHAYNSVDASLWYMWAVQQLLFYMPEEEKNIQKYCWPLIKEIIATYTSGAIPNLSMDADGFLHVGTKDTQLTWMDANAYGKPVTPRYGCPIEISALWYNGLAFAQELSTRFKEKSVFPDNMLDKMPDIFMDRYWVKDKKGSYLADVWRPDGPVKELRPNQIFALSMKYSMVDKKKGKEALKRVKKDLLTPYGLRTLSPKDPAYHSLYRGGPNERDASYHQGTVWPWLIGAYGEALLKLSSHQEKDTLDLLETIHPLLKDHLYESGLGSISEIFDGDPPHLPDGCIAQAWSIAEPLRLIKLIQKETPSAYEKWLIKHYKEML